MNENYYNVTQSTFCTCLYKYIVICRGLNITLQCDYNIVSSCYKDSCNNQAIMSALFEQEIDGSGRLDAGHVVCSVNGIILMKGVI